jgi:small subunit ribosomal protein S2
MSDTLKNKENLNPEATTGQSGSDNSFLKSLIKSGIHFGHQTARWNPKMECYIWGQKNNVHLIDVSKTARQLEKAAQFLESIAAQGKNILLVGTKKAAQDPIYQLAIELKIPFVTHRWIGGILSNFPQVKKSITKLLHYEDIIAKSEKMADRQFYTKKELNVLQKTCERLNKNVGGIRTLTMPLGAIVLIDTRKEHSALKEAVRMGVPVVALVDTNNDPSMVDFVIPGNDDSPRAIKLVLDYLGKGIAKGQQASSTKKASKASADMEIDQMPQETIDLSLIEREVETEGEGTGSKTKRKVEPMAATKARRPRRDDTRGVRSVKPKRDE